MAATLAAAAVPAVLFTCRSNLLSLVGVFRVMFAWITGSCAGQALSDLQHGVLYLFLQSVKSLERSERSLHTKV